MSSKLQWFRLYHRIIDDEKLRLLAFEDRWHFIAVCCLKADGLLDEADTDLKWRKIAVKFGVQLRELDEIKRRLVEVGLVDDNLQPLAWDKRQYQKPDLPSGETLDGFSGYVYFITEQGTSSVKIGYSKNPWARIKELQTGRPGKLTVVATVKTTEVSEQRVHDIFASERMGGEWFRLSGRISSIINEIKKKRIKTDSDVVSYANSYVATKPTTTETEAETETEAAVAPAKPGDLLDKLLAAAGIKGNPTPQLAFPGEIIGLMQAGYDLEGDILPAIRARPKPDVRSWGYFVPQIRDAVDRRKSAASVQRPEPAKVDWSKRVNAFYEDGIWPMSWGPRPGDPGCEAPAHLIARSAA